LGSSVVTREGDTESAAGRAPAGGKTAARPSYRGILPWLGLGCILVAYIDVVLRLHPTNFFGFTTDDAIYFSSAKAIAEGRGYIVPSLPGTPAATKYPVLYPWLLSWVWRWNPSFPANVATAVGFSIAFTLLFLGAVFVFLRRLGGLSEIETFLITALCALHPALLFYGSNVLTDIPFAALALAAMIVAERAAKQGASVKAAVVCGILGGLAAQMRSIGIAVIAGIALTALVRRAGRQFFVFCATASACLLPVLGRQIFYRQAMPWALASDANFGWDKTWLFYTSYVGFWRMSVPSRHVLFAMLGQNVLWLLRMPSDYLLLPSLARGGVFGLMVLLVVTALICAGIVRQGRRYGWKALHWVIPFYAAVVLVWNFSDPYRYFIPFLPLFVAGYWLETKRIVRQAKEALVRRRRIGEACLAGALVALIAGGNGAILWNEVRGGWRMLSGIGAERSSLFRAKHEAYDWISRFTPPDSRVIAYDDAELYLYTGRQAAPAVTFTSAEYIEPERMLMSLDHMTDVATATGAEYWVVSSDDFRLLAVEVREAANQRIGEIARSLPLLFRSSDGRVRVYDLKPMQRQASAARQSEGPNPGFER
jgi:hypothetical protein